MRFLFSRRAFCRGMAVTATGSGVRAADFESRNAFRDFVIAVGRRHFPNMPFAVGDGVVISGGHTLYLDNIRHIVRQLPPPMREDAIVEWLRRFSPDADRRAEAIKASARSWDGAKPLLRPRLMPRSRADDLPGLVREPFQADLALFYTIDLGDKDLYVTDDKFKCWNVPLAQVHDAAVGNLDDLSATMTLDPKTIDGVKGRYLTVSKGDGYDASRILLPRFRKRLLEKLGPVVFVGVPAKDLMVCWSADFANPEAMVKMVEENATRLPYVVTTQIFALTDRGLDEVYLATDDADAKRQAAAHGRDL